MFSAHHFQRFVIARLDVSNPAFSLLVNKAKTGLLTSSLAMTALMLMIFLSSCSHVRNNDGPPDYSVDVSRIPNAVPKPEPLARYGNNKSYVVFGKRYYTLQKGHNYNEIGTAYGMEKISAQTSSGERYDMLSMTAAHKAYLCLLMLKSPILPITR